MSALPTSPFVLDVLRLVQRSGGRATFYTLDRALTYAPQLYGRREAWDAGTVGGDLMPALHELEEVGLIRSEEHRSDRARYTSYGLTEAGQRCLEPATAGSSAALT